MSDEMLKLADEIDNWSDELLTSKQRGMISSALRAAAASAEPVAWQWQSPGGNEWHTMTAQDDPLVREALEAQGYRYRHLYPSAPDAEIVAALRKIADGKSDDPQLDALRALAKAKGGAAPTSNNTWQGC